MTPDIAIAWLIINLILICITFVWGILRYRRGIWYRKLVLKFQAYLLWGIGVISLVISFYPFAYLYTEHLLHFEDVGYADVFWTIRKIKWGLFAGFFFVAVALMNVNAFIANRLCPEPREFSRWTHDRTKSFHKTLVVGTILLAIILAVPMMSLHDTFIRFLERPTEKIEPFLYGKDRNFFLFSFPIHQAVSLWMQIMVLVTCAVVGLLYNFYYRRDARSMGRVKRHIVLHGSFLWILLLAVEIWRSQVNLWGKVYTHSLSRRISHLTGIFFADDKLAFSTYIYAAILLAIGLFLLINLFWRRRIIWYALITLWITSYITLIHLYPIGVNFWAVRTAGEAYPVEQVYLTDHMKDTRIAYDLDKIVKKPYEKGLATLDIIERNPDVKNNIQFWDRRVLYNIFRNEEIKLHHEFHPYTDVDRYHLGRTLGSEENTQDTDSNESTSIGQDQGDILSVSSEQYRQVMIAAREISPDKGPKEWGELKLKFTHGYGVCVAPVNEVVSGGSSPDLWVKGVPITQKEGMSYQELEVEQPRIYYGEMTDEYVIVNTKKPEYNVELEEGKTSDTSQTNKKNKKNESKQDEKSKYTEKGYHYTGTGGIELGGFFRRLCFAVRFTSVYILRNSALKPESRIMFARKIGTRSNRKLVKDRLSHIAPFLDYDPDPYIVIHDGKLWWLVDFYVTSDKFPNAQFYTDDTAPIEENGVELYAEPRYKRFKRFNYIRNSGVAVVNAYNGDVNYYTDIVDETITEIYKRAFPNLFKNIDEMPDGLKEHRRFPDYLTRIQAKMYGNYHVENAETFFHRNKQWRIPKEAYYSDSPDQEMMPYYIMLKLPGEEKIEFVNMIPFTPPRKENFMKGWLIARCDPPNYGQRIVYTLPDDLNVKGPKHVEDDIPKNSELAELFRNWKPNKIIRGNLHVIPIEEGIFYVEPIYFERTDKKKNGSTDETDPILHLPTLQTIVVKAADHELAADLSFDLALEKMFLSNPSTDLNDTEVVEDEEQEPTLSERIAILVEGLEELKKAASAIENGNGQAAPKKAGNKKKKNNQSN